MCMWWAHVNGHAVIYLVIFKLSQERLIRVIMNQFVYELAQVETHDQTCRYGYQNKSILLAPPKH